MSKTQQALASLEAKLAAANLALATNMVEHQECKDKVVYLQQLADTFRAKWNAEVNKRTKTANTAVPYAESRAAAIEQCLASLPK